MNISKMHSICKQEKKKAMERWESDDSAIQYDAAQAINLWDELLGQLHKPGNVKKSHIDKAKKTAHRLCNMISNNEYKKQTRKKIESL